MKPLLDPDPEQMFDWNVGPEKKSFKNPNHLQKPDLDFRLFNTALALTSAPIVCKFELGLPHFCIQNREPIECGSYMHDPDPK
jgi:hypothetical protein